jgi:hypothetical protein
MPFWCTQSFYVDYEDHHFPIQAALKGQAAKWPDPSAIEGKSYE